MTLDYIEIGLGIVILLVYFTILFLLFEIKSRISGKIGIAFTFLVAGTIALIIRRVMFIFRESAIISVPHLTTIFSLIFSLLFLASSYIFYKSITEITDLPKRKTFNKPKQSARNINPKKNVRSFSTPFRTARNNSKRQDYVDWTKK